MSRPRELTNAPQSVTTRTGRPVALVLHFGEAAIRGTEVCLIQTITGLASAGYEVLLAANHPEVVASFIGLPPESVIACEFPAVYLEQRSWKAPFPRHCWHCWYRADLS